MAGYPRRTLAVRSTGHTYDYICIKPASPKKATLVFLHGFPAIADGWNRQIGYFASLGYGIIAPDLLGFGGTSKPHAVLEYCSWVIAEDMFALLDHEKLELAHGIGHDAGAYVLSRLYNYSPRRWSSLTFIAVPYSPPGIHFDMDIMKQITENLIGFEKFGYVRFLAADGSHKLIEEHLDSFLSIAFNADVNVRADNFYPPGKLEAWLRANQTDDKLVLNAEEKQAWLEAFREGDWQAATNGYRLMTQNLNENDEKADLAASKMATKIEVPVLVIDAQPDKATVPGSMEKAIRPYIGETGQVTFKTVKSQGHFPHIVSSGEVNQAIHTLLESVDTQHKIQDVA